ncbi:MAG TPA: hypothetical protein VMU61_00275 [Candidatus Aquilonibacter sp.]|nr:hypothetical protein [Candidatus Aquilonibacter sp.]
MQLGTESKKKVIVASVLGCIAVLILAYQLIPSSSTSASVPVSNSNQLQTAAAQPARSGARRHGSTVKTVRPPSLDPTLHLAELAAAEQIQYEGSGRNIFVSQADPVIPQPVKSGATDHPKETQTPVYTPPPVAPPPPIPLKFFGFASGPGEPKKIFLSKGDDVFIAGEGEIVDRRYKVLRISPTSVEMQDVIGSGPPQNLPLIQG